MLQLCYANMDWNSQEQTAKQVHRNTQDAAASGDNDFESTPDSVEKPHALQSYASSHAPHLTSFTPTIPLQNCISPVSQIHDRYPQHGYPSFHLDDSVNPNHAYFTQPTFSADSAPFSYYAHNLRGLSSSWFNPIIGHGYTQQRHAQANFDGTTISNSSIYIAKGNCNISKKLKRALKEEATKECTSKGLVPLINQNIEVCKLDLTNKLSRNISKPPKKNREAANTHYDEYDGHYNRRQDYERIELRYNSKISVENLFKKATEPNCPWLRNSVALVGQPGIGKTTLCKVITEKALSGNTEGLKNIDLFFYIPVKKIDFETEVSVDEFLVKHALPFTPRSKLLEKDQSIYTPLLDNESVFIALDGLDEAATEWNQCYNSTLGRKEKNNPLQYLLGLLNGQVLPNAKKLFTSRQTHFYDMDESCRKMLVAEVLGLSTASQETLCRSICTDKDVEVWNIIRSNPNLSYSCYVPAKCIFIAFTIWKSLSENGSGQFHSITHVFANGFKYYLKSKLVRGRKEQKENQKYLNKIAKLAWDGFIHKRLVFETDHLTEAGIDPRHDNDILDAFVTDENWNMTILDGDKKKTFSHLTWQEFFAACYLVYFASDDEFCKLIPKFKSNRWEVVTKFLFGLCNSKVSKVTTCCFSDAISFFDVKKQKLLEFGRWQMQKVEAGGKKLLQICSWLQEINDEDFYTEVGPIAPKTITLTGSILLTDISSIEKMCQESTQTHDIKISKSCTFPHGSFRLLLDKLDGNKIQDFVINNNMSVQMIKDLSKTTLKINGQLIIDCHGVANVHAFLEKMSKHYQPAQKMKYLDISGSPISRSILKLLISHDVVEKLDELFVMQYKISEAGIKAVGKVDVYANINKDVFWNQTLLEDIYTKVVFLIKSLPDSLHVKCNDEAHALSCSIHLFPPTLKLTLEKVNKFALQEVLMSIKNELTSLNLDDNSVNDESASALAECIHNLKQLSLRNSQMSNHGWCQVATAVSHLSPPLKSLNIDDSIVDDEIASALAECIHNTKQLSLRKCRISNHGWCQFARAVSHLPQPITSLNFDDSKVNDESTSAVAACVQNTKQLSLRNCYMSNHSLCQVARAVSQLSQPMNSLDISENSIPRSVLKQLMSHDVFEKLKKLLVTQYIISEKGIEAVNSVDLYANINKDQLQNETHLEEIYTKVAFMIVSIPNTLSVFSNYNACALSYVMHLFPPTLELTFQYVDDFALQEVFMSMQQKIKSLTIGPHFYVFKFSQETENLFLQHASKVQDKLILIDVITSPDFKAKFEQLPDPKPKLILEWTR